MNNKQKNRKNKTSKVYSLLPEYQYVTGINNLQNGGQAFGYEDFMTNQLFKAEDGTETKKTYSCTGVPCDYAEYREHYKSLTGSYPPGDTDNTGQKGTTNPNAVECPEGQQWDATAQACVMKTIDVKEDKKVDNTSDDGTNKDNEALNNPNNLPAWMTNSYSTAYNPHQGYNAGYPFQDEHSEAVNSIMDNSLLGAAFITANKLKGSGKSIKNAFANINPKTGKPYSHTDYGVSTITNTTDENVLLNPDGLKDLYDDKGRIIDENNTAGNLFINQNDAKANYFNQAADYFTNTFVDDEGNPRMSKQTMDDDGNITYADIEEEVDVANPSFNPDLPEGPDNQMFVKQTQTRAHTDNDLTPGDKAQEHVKDMNVQRLQYNEDGTVKGMTRINDEGKTETIPYDPNAIYKEGVNKEEINRQEIINQGQYGYELPKAQDGLAEFCTNAPIINSGGKVFAQCRNRDYDSKHDAELGATMSLGKLNNDFTSSFGLSGGYTYNPSGGTGGLKTYLGGNYGVRGTENSSIDDGLNGTNVDMNAYMKALISAGYTGEVGGNSYNWQTPLQYELGAYADKDLMGNNGTTFGGYTRLGPVNIKGGYNPNTGSEFSIGLGLPIRQDGGNPDESLKEELSNEFNKANVSHYVEPTNNTTEDVPYGGVTVANNAIRNFLSKSNSDGESSYESDYITNSNQAAASGADKIMANRTWMGNLLNKSNVVTANINKKRHLKSIMENYGMTPDELLATGQWQLGEDGSIVNTPYVASSYSHSKTRDGDMEYNDVFGTFTEPNSINNNQGSFNTSITKNRNMEFMPEDADTYWENIGQYSTGDDNIYSNPAYRGSFLPEAVIKGQYGGQLAYFQNGGAPQPSGRTYKIDGRIVTKQEYDNYVANGGDGATTDDDNIIPPVQPPVVPPVVPSYGPNNAPIIDDDADEIPDLIDVDAGSGTGEPLEGVEPYSPAPAAPASFAYTDKPELTQEQMDMMTEDQIEKYNKMRGREEKYNEVKAIYNTSLFGKVEKGVSEGINQGMKAVDFVNQVGTKAQLAVDEVNADNANDEFSDFNTAIEASRSDKGDFDVNSGVYRANTLGYGDGPRGQIAQMGAEMNNKPAPDYTYLKQFLDSSIVSYDPSFLMTQARDGEEIDADIELIKQLMAAGADFEII